MKGTNFTYLGSTVSSKARKGLTTQAKLLITYVRGYEITGMSLSEPNDNRHVSIWAKCKVYSAVVLSTLLYGAEVWTIAYTEQRSKS